MLDRIKNVEFIAAFLVVLVFIGLSAINSFLPAGQGVSAFEMESRLSRHELTHITDAYQYLDSVLRSGHPEHSDVPELRLHVERLEHLARKTAYTPLARDLDRFATFAERAEDLYLEDWLVLRRIVHDIHHFILEARTGNPECWDYSYAVRDWLDQ